MAKDKVERRWNKELDHYLKSVETNSSVAVDVIAQKLEADLNSPLKIGFFGSPGCGKSALMDTLIGEQKTDTGVTPGTNVTTHTWGENDSIMFVDLPGYGGLDKDHTVSEYWDNFEIDSFDALLCCFETKLNQDDENFFKEAIAEGIQVIFVRTKTDTLHDEEKSKRELKREIRQHLIYDVFGSDSVLIFTSARTKMGIDKLNFAIIDHLDTDKKAKYYRNAKAYSDLFLEEKAKAAHRVVMYYSFISAGSGAVPVPFLGAAIDIPAVMRMTNQIGRQFGITERRLRQLTSEQEDKLRMYEQLIRFMAKGSNQKIMTSWLSKNAAKEATKNFSKLVPIVGGAGLGFGLTYYTGREAIEGCREIASEILETEIHKKRS